MCTVLVDKFILTWFARVLRTCLPHCLCFVSISVKTSDTSFYLDTLYIQEMMLYALVESATTSTTTTSDFCLKDILFLFAIF